MFIWKYRWDGDIASSAGMMRGRSVGDMAACFVDIVLHFAMHAQEVFLDMIGAIELLETSVALEGLLVLVDVLVTSVEIATIRRVGTMSASITFDDWHAVGGQLGLVFLAIVAATATTTRTAVTGGGAS